MISISTEDNQQKNEYLPDVHQSDPEESAMTTSRNSPVFITFLWHMHQPIYIKPQDGSYFLPWVRLHAIKDYYDMAAFVEAVPQMQAVFNIVPSLFIQLEEYVEGSARDPFLVYSSKPVSELTDDEKLFLLKNFFTVNKQRKIEPSYRYSELLEKQTLTKGQLDKSLNEFTPQDYLDLQVLFNLAWSGATLKRDPEIAALVDKDRNFSQEEKELLLNKQQELISRIIPTYKRLQDNGQIEISLSPFYHPLLPLVCDNYEAENAQAGIALPDNRFVYPKDAEEQIRLAVEYYRKIFKAEPQGMWPPEGAVSNKALELAIKQGIKWLASDEKILLKSLKTGGNENKEPLSSLSAESLYSPWHYKNKHGEIPIFFRNQLLSNLISFIYSSWDEEKAADDFYDRLVAEKNRFKKKGTQFILSIIMDGENAWEYFPQGGKVFLLSLYQKIVGCPHFKPITFSKFLSLKNKDRKLSLSHIAPGSWIEGNFSTWIGEEAKNEAWNHLFEARRTFKEWLANLTPDEKKKKRESIEKALKALYIAEGSDWFWWLKRGEQPESERMFSVLFKSYLGEMYRSLSLDIPLNLRFAV